MKFNDQLLQGVLQNSREQAIAYACKSYDNRLAGGTVRHYAVYYGKDKIFDTSEREESKLA
jgi:hypothetical protein